MEVRDEDASFLRTYWEVGQYISEKLKTSQWGTNVENELADYLKRQNPKRRGFGRRHLYNMVKFYEVYSASQFVDIVDNMHLSEFVQLPIAQIQNTLIVMPNILNVISFTSHIEIMNRCNTYEERLFYMMYASHQKLKAEELRRLLLIRCIYV